MKSKKHGKSILGPEVTHISSKGIWVLLSDREYFLDYDLHPWFKDARLSEIQNVRMEHGQHLWWPDLDIDLELESLDHPERYPLVSLRSPVVADRKAKR